MIRRCHFGVAVAAICGLLLIVSSAIIGAQQQTAAPGAETNMTHQQAEQLLKQLKIIRQLLEKQQRLAQPVEAKVSGKGFAIGDPNAPLTLVEFSDYQCPFCAQFQNDTFEMLRKDFIDTGRVRFVIRDFPLASHSNAVKAAEAARCGADQGEFWEMHNTLVAHFQQLKEESLLMYAQQQGLNLAEFKRCMDSEKYLPEIQQDEADAKASGIFATPTFVLGVDKDGIVDGVRLVGARPLTTFSEEIGKQLAKANAISEPVKPATTGAATAISLQNLNSDR